MASRIVELAEAIARNTEIVDNFFSQHGLPSPSFDIDGPARVAIPESEPDIAAAHVAVLDATQQLHSLMKGPTGVLMGISAHDCLSLQAVYRYRVAHAIPVGEKRSFGEISSLTGLNVFDLRRLVRHAMCNHIFCEPQAGYVAHTAASRLLVDSQIVQDFVGIAVEERFPAEARTMDAIALNGGEHTPENCGFALGHNTDKGLYTQMDTDPTRGRRWAGAMSAMASLISVEPLLSAFDWASLGKGTVVDVAGGWGPVSVGTAKRFPELSFIGQDLPGTIEEARSKIPVELKNRIRLMPIDLLEPQPVTDANVYYFRAIFHNWPDQHCIRILRNRVPALAGGARLIIDDNILPEPNSLPAPIIQKRRSMDLNMLTFFGSQERSIADFSGLLEEADPHLYLQEVINPKPNEFYLVVQWQD